MPLTHEIRDRESWVRVFLDERFRELNGWVRGIGGKLKSIRTEVPLRCGAASARTVGKALDFRLRLHFGWRPGESDALAVGMRLAARGGGGAKGRLGRRRDAMNAILSGPVPDDGAALAATSVVLAWIDDLYRGNGWSDGMVRVADLAERGRVATWDECAAEVDAGIASEVCSLMEPAVREFGTARAICGPEFAGSAAVGGADADMVVDGCLYEVKTTVAPRDRLLFSARQLLGYVLLDWRDEYGLERAGFYFSRQGRRMSWPLGQLIARTTGEPEASVAALRADFRACAEEQMRDQQDARPRRGEGLRP